MKIVEEIYYDLDFEEPKVIVSHSRAVIENVKSIVMISENSLTAECGKRYVTLVGNDFTIKEIFEGRLLIEGTIQRVEFLSTSSSDKDRRF